MPRLVFVFAIWLVHTYSMQERPATVPCAAWKAGQGESASELWISYG